MRDVIGAYQTQVVELAHRKIAHTSMLTRFLAAYRSRLSAHMDQIADYLNWYERDPDARKPAALLDEYIRTADLLDNDPGPPRTDPISKYMDSVQQQLSQ